jgi:hypothetical protein
LTSVIVSPEGEVLVVVLFPAPLVAWAILSCIRLKGVSGGSSGTDFPCRTSASAFPASRSEYVPISAADVDAAVQFSSIPVDVPVTAVASFIAAAAASTGAVSTGAACGTAAAIAAGAFFGKAGGGFSGLMGLWLAGGVPRKGGAISMTKRVSLTGVSLMGAGVLCRTHDTNRTACAAMIAPRMARVRLRDRVPVHETSATGWHVFVVH